MGVLKNYQNKQAEKQKKAAEEKEVSMKQLFELEEELEETREKYGVKPKEGKFSRLINSYFNYKDSREKLLLSKKKYIWLSVLTGWMGGHRFYAKQYRVALLYLLTFWSGFPLAMTIIDLMIVIPMKADSAGMILI